jgi:hypothetical protein
MRIGDLRVEGKLKEGGVQRAVAPVPDQRRHDSTLSGAVYGLPQSKCRRYNARSPSNFVEGLSGKWLLVHGLGDDNGRYQALRCWSIDGWNSESRLTS